MCTKATSLNKDDAIVTRFRSYVGLPHAALMTLRHNIPPMSPVSRTAVAVGKSISGHHVQISTHPIPLGDLHE